MGSAGLYIAAIVIFALGAAAGAGFYLYRRKGNGDMAPRFFAPRSRRLAFIERTALEGGRKLLLVRRDDVEHLILVGGPIDLVVESGIRSEGVVSVPAKEASFTPAVVAPSAWPLDVPDAPETVADAEPQVTLFPQVKEEKSAPVLAAAPAVRAAE